MGLEGAQLGIYRVGRELGRGGMGTVHRAESTAGGPAGPAGTAVALKVFHRELVSDEEAFGRFRLEAEIGKQIRHQQLVRTYELASAETDAGPVHFTVMELVDGRTLEALLAELGTFPAPLLREVADQVLRGLHAIHERGVVHRDLKPANIVITPDHRALLMDLGVARRRDKAERTRTGEFVGSLAYAPPEQFGAGDVGPRADLYAFGVTLYELATGQNPYGDADVTAVVRRKLDEELPPPRSVHPDLDGFLDKVIATCVRRAPADRFASAAELRQILREGETSAWWTAQTDGRPAYSAEPALRRLRTDRPTPRVGRDAELAALRARHDRARAGGAVLLLGGPSGIGKSRLLYDHLEEVAGAGGPVVAAGRAVGAGGRGYGPFAEALGDLLGADPRARLAELLEDAPGVVAPLAEFARGRLQPGPDSGLSKDALFAAVVATLRAIAATRPLVLVVDDLHLAGAETVELFRHVARCVPGHPIFLVGVYASDGVEEGSSLEPLLGGDGFDRLDLDRLDDALTEELVRLVVRNEATVRAAAPTLRSRSEGNPLLVLESLAHFREAGLLEVRKDGLALTGDLEEAAVPATVRDLVGLKLGGLDEEQRETLEAAAILGVEFETALLAEVLEEPAMELVQRLAGLARRRRLLASAGPDSFRFAGRQLYDAVYDAIPPALRAEYHALVADTLLERGGAPDGATAYALLRHLFHADRAPEAAPFLEPALDHAMASFHAAYVAPFLEKVDAALDGAEPAARFALAMTLWACYDLLGSRADQMRVLQRAGEAADALDEPGRRARVHAYRAGSYWYAGDYDKAHSEARAGLDLARAAGDRTWESTCHHTLGVVAFRRGELEACAERWRTALAIRREIGDRRGQASTLQALALVMPSVGEADGVLATMQEALGIWRAIGERRGEASMLMNIGNRLVDAADYDAGLRHLEQAIELHRDTGAAVNEALALTNLGRALDIVGRIDDARAAWDRALGLFVDVRNPNGELAARVMLGGALGGYGEYDEARTHLGAAIELAEETGNRTKLATAHRALGEVLHRSGARGEAWTHLEQALAIDEELKSRSSRVLTLAVLGNAALDEEAWERAAGHLAAALDDARAGDATQAPLVLCRLARAHRGTGRTTEARACIDEARERVEAAGEVSSHDGTEIYYTLALFDEDAGRREGCVDRARALVRARAARIRNDAFREHYLTRTWPNAEVLVQWRDEA